MTVGDGDGAADRTTQPVTLADIARRGHLTLDGLACDQRQGLRLGVRRARLLDAADRLGYVPNASARTLKQKTSRVVGVVVSDLGNQFYGRLSAAIEQTLREADFQMVLVGDNSENAEELAAVRTFLAMRAPGVIMTPVGAEACELLSRHGISVVEVDRRLAGGVRRGRDRQRARRARRGGAPCGPDIGAWRCWSPTPTGRATSAGSPATGRRTTRPRCRWTSG